MKIAFNESYVHPVPENHRFPMAKYSLLKQDLLACGIVKENDFFNPGIVQMDAVLSVHSPSYVNRLVELGLSEKEQRLTGFIHNEQLIQREQIIMEGTRKCAELALIYGVGMNIAGGTHHAYSSRGEGFCLLNDQAIAAAWLMKYKNINKVLIVDLDVHQGNGTAEIFQKEERVFTFSMHGKNNYPLKKEHSDLDIELEDGCGDTDYLYLLELHLERILQLFEPDFIFYQCGVDVLQSDKLGRIALSEKGCLKRDLLVMEMVRQMGVPLVCSMGGGYSPDCKDIVRAHQNTFEAAQSILGR